MNLKQGDGETDAACAALYKGLKALGLDPLYDDRRERASGQICHYGSCRPSMAITVGPRGLKNGVVELSSRRTGEMRKCR